MKKFSLRVDAAPSVSERAYEVLRDSIVAGTLKGGDRIVETQIAKDMGISRGPVREAVQRLLQEGLVESVPRRGPQVVSMSLQQIQQLYSVRVSLEKLAIRQAIERDADEAADRLERSVRKMENAARKGSFADLVEEEFRFHELLCALSGNPYLIRVYRSIHAYVRMALDIDNSSYPDLATIAAEHRPLVESVRRRRSREAERLIEQHILHSLEHIRETSREVRRPPTAIKEPAL